MFFQVWVSFWKFCFWESFWDERVDVGMEWWLDHDAMMVGREQRWLHLVWVCGKKMSGCVGIALCYSKQNHSWPSIPYHIIPTTRHHKIQHNSIWYQVGVSACCHIDTQKRLLPRKCSSFMCLVKSQLHTNCTWTIQTRGCVRDYVTYLPTT